MATKNTSAKGGKSGDKKSSAKKTILVITQEIFDLNKDFLETEGVEVGNEVELTKELKKALKMPKKSANVGSAGPAPAKVKCPCAILRGEEYVRTYGKGMEDAVASLLSKSPNYSVVDPADIVSVSVEWREEEKVQDRHTNRMEATGKTISRREVFTEESHGEDFLDDARKCANETPGRSCTVKLSK